MFLAIFRIALCRDMSMLTSDVLQCWLLSGIVETRGHLVETIQSRSHTPISYNFAPVRMRALSCKNITPPPPFTERDAEPIHLQLLHCGLAMPGDSVLQTSW